MWHNHSKAWHMDLCQCSCYSTAHLRSRWVQIARQQRLLLELDYLFIYFLIAQSQTHSIQVTDMHSKCHPFLIEMLNHYIRTILSVPLVVVKCTLVPSGITPWQYVIKHVHLQWLCDPPKTTQHGKLNIFFLFNQHKVQLKCTFPGMQASHFVCTCDFQYLYLSVPQIYEEICFLFTFIQQVSIYI